MELTFALLAMIAAVRPEVAGDSAQAFSKQYQIDQKLDRYSRKIASDEARQAVGHATLVAKVVIERQVVFKWEF